MVAPADFAMIHGSDLWYRVAHDNTSIATEEGVVQLAWLEEEPTDAPAPLPSPGGLAFDPWCRLYHSLPDDGQVERLLWAAKTTAQQEPIDLFASEQQQAGDFTKAATGMGPLQHPTSLAVDDKGHLYVLEAGMNRVLVYDVIDRRLLRKLIFDQPVLDLTTDGGRVYVLLNEPFAIAVMDAQHGPHIDAPGFDVAHPSRLCVNQQHELFVLADAGMADAAIYPVARPDEHFTVPYAGDIEFTQTGILVVARSPGEDFLRFHVEQGSQRELTYLNALRYDGKGIVCTPDDHIGFWTDRGFAHATLARVKYVPQGRVTSYRLDSGEFQSIWGRVFIDACIPKGTSVKIACLAMDEPPEDIQLLDRTPPLKTMNVVIARPDLSPPMPPKSFVENLPVTQTVFKRTTGREFPWLCRKTSDVFATYEAPVIAQQGRYLWVVLELNGTSRTTPRIKSVRVEYPAHELLRHLPQIYSKQLPQADFLRRYLGMPESFLRDLELRSAYRNILLDPLATPKEALSWLAGFMGMVLDERWSERAKRTLIKQANWLFRFRGTVMGLKRFIEIYLDMQIQIIEHFKVRGLGGAFVGEDASLNSSAVLGAGFRIGGSLDNIGQVSVNKTSILDAFKTHAHRFSVIVPLVMNAEQASVVAHILDVHRPAHTMYDVCSIDAGMRIGKSLYTGLTTMVGRDAAFGQLQLNDSLLGRTDILGQPVMGSRVGVHALGQDSRVG